MLNVNSNKYSQVMSLIFELEEDIDLLLLKAEKIKNKKENINSENLNIISIEKKEMEKSLSKIELLNEIKTEDFSNKSDKVLFDDKVESISIPIIEDDVLLFNEEDIIIENTMNIELIDNKNDIKVFVYLRNGERKHFKVKKIDEIEKMFEKRIHKYVSLKNVSKEIGKIEKYKTKEYGLIKIIINKILSFLNKMKKKV